MPIRFCCTCGKVMTAKDEFAGRKLKCGQCGQVVAIPQKAVARPRPVAPVVKRPPLDVSEEEPAAPPARSSLPNTAASEASRAAPNVWEDRSLIQQPTAWRPGDEERFQPGIRLPREGPNPLVPVVAAVLVVGIVAAILFIA